MIKVDIVMTLSNLIHTLKKERLSAVNLLLELNPFYSRKIDEYFNFQEMNYFYNIA